jgi:hypothetical protein
MHSAYCCRLLEVTRSRLKTKHMPLRAAARGSGGAAAAAGRYSFRERGRSRLFKRVVPALQRIMVDKHKVRAHVALTGG